MSLLMSWANAGWVGGMRAMGHFDVVVVTHLDFSEAGRRVRIIIESGMVPFFQSGVMFVALNQG